MRDEGAPHRAGGHWSGVLRWLRPHALRAGVAMPPAIPQDMLWEEKLGLVLKAVPGQELDKAVEALAQRIGSCRRTN
jgi:hypothetical protein